MVFETLTTSGAISMGALVRKLEGKVNRSSVYRTIDLFEKIGIVNRSRIGWKYKLELSERFSTHHHYATCVQCGNVVEFSEDSSIEAEIDQIADRINLDLIVALITSILTRKTAKIHRDSISVLNSTLEHA